MTVIIVNIYVSEVNNKVRNIYKRRSVTQATYIAERWWWLRDQIKMFRFFLPLFNIFLYIFYHLFISSQSFDKGKNNYHMKSLIIFITEKNFYSKKLNDIFSKKVCFGAKLHKMVINCDYLILLMVLKWQK